MRYKNSILLALASVLCACGGGGGASVATAEAAASAAARLGKKLFEDQALSVSGQQSCATCHVAACAFASDPRSIGPDRGSPVPLGGADMNQPGLRNAPSLMYGSYSPQFHFDAAGNPQGGFFRDGRAASLADQAIAPFTTVFEMANADAAAVIARLKTRPYLQDFADLYGSDVLADPQTALKRVGQALAAYQTQDAEFHPFSSKYDYWQKGQASLTRQELNGLALFNNPAKGNCAACHPSNSADGVTPALFTDFSFDNLGVPRNAKLAANDPSTAPAYVPSNGNDGVHTYYDLGICDPLRDNGGANLSGICGQFKVPTLRNVALTAPYFHNGEFPTLASAIAFYVRRDTDPQQFYPRAADGAVAKFDDLPQLYGGQFVIDINQPGGDAGYLGNVNTAEIPYDRALGAMPALSPAEINELISFLCTLTDGFDPDRPAEQVLPAQCQAAAAAS